MSKIKLKRAHEVVKIPRPYTAQLSDKYPGIEILYEEDPILLLPLQSNFTNIVKALNGAFMMGVIYGRH